MPKKLNLVGVAEIAEMFGVSRQRVHQLFHDHADFPEPVAELGAGRLKMKIWLREDVERWAKRHGRETVPG